MKPAWGTLGLLCGLWSSCASPTTEPKLIPTADPDEGRTNETLTAEAQHRADADHKFQQARDSATAVRVAMEAPRCIATLGDPTSIRCEFETREECYELNQEFPADHQQPCAETLPTRADIAAAEQAEAQRADARHALSLCQDKLNQTDGKTVAECWQKMSSNWGELIPAGTADEVGDCLGTALGQWNQMDFCVGKPAISDHEVLSKHECLTRLAKTSTLESCGPFDMKPQRARHVSASDVEVMRNSVAARARAITARVEKCHGSTAIQLAVALRFNSNISASTLRGCVYSTFGTVATTTVDGWVMVDWSGQGGAPLGAAFRTGRRFVDGAFMRAENARFLGVDSFRRVDGGTLTVPTFRLAD